MSNDKVVRPDGYYLVRHYSGSSLQVEIIHRGDLYCNGEYYSLDAISIHWIADEPLDLECIKLLQMNGGLQNAVELVKKDATADKVVNYE